MFQHVEIGDEVQVQHVVDNNDHPFLPVIAVEEDFVTVRLANAQGLRVSKHWIYALKPQNMAFVAEQTQPVAVVRETKASKKAKKQGAAHSESSPSPQQPSLL